MVYKWFTERDISTIILNPKTIFVLFSYIAGVMKLASQIMCFTFASLVLFSGSYVVMEFHICTGSVQNVSLFTKAKGCRMEHLPPCHRQESKPCCEDKTIVHEGQSYNSSIVKVDLPVVSFVDVINPPVLVSEIIPTVDFSTPEYVDYDPPLRTPDLTVSLHTFLI